MWKPFLRHNFWILYKTLSFGNEISVDFSFNSIKKGKGSFMPVTCSSACINHFRFNFNRTYASERKTQEYFSRRMQLHKFEYGTKMYLNPYDETELARIRY